jgi:hypothetical protein
MTMVQGGRRGCEVVSDCPEGMILLNSDRQEIFIKKKKKKKIFKKGSTK